MALKWQSWGWEGKSVHDAGFEREVRKWRRNSYWKFTCRFQGLENILTMLICVLVCISQMDLCVG